jgi:hypothetical protein
MRDATPRLNHWLWSGPLVALAGFVSYFVVFAAWAATRDVPWVNLPLVLLGAGMSVWGARLAVKRGGWRIAVGGLAALFSVGLAGLLAFYCFILSYQMPAPTAASDTGAELPALTLPAHDGTAVVLREAAKEKLVLAFFRGAW